MLLLFSGVNGYVARLQVEEKKEGSKTRAFQARHTATNLSSMALSASVSVSHMTRRVQPSQQVLPPSQNSFPAWH
jgi:hypothetical protein